MLRSCYSFKRKIPVWCADGCSIYAYINKTTLVDVNIRTSRSNFTLLSRTPRVILALEHLTLNQLWPPPLIWSDYYAVPYKFSNIYKLLTFTFHKMATSRRFPTLGCRSCSLSSSSSSSTRGHRQPNLTPGFNLILYSSVIVVTQSSKN